MSAGLFLNLQKDDAGRMWGVARICTSDGGCIVVESRIYRQRPGESANPWPEMQSASGADDSAKNLALDEALDKLCTLSKKPGIRDAIPLPARMALALVCKARNLQKIKKAAEQEGDDDRAEEAGAEYTRLTRSHNPITQRVMGAMRLWG